MQTTRTDSRTPNRKMLGFTEFMKRRNGNGRSRLTKVVSEDSGNGDAVINDAVYGYISTDSDSGSKQIICSDLAQRVRQMSDYGDVFITVISVAEND